VFDELFNEFIVHHGFGQVHFVGIHIGYFDASAFPDCIFSGDGMVGAMDLLVPDVIFD